MKTRILVVDDEKTVHETIRSILGEDDYEFRMCLDKAQAEQLIRNETFDLAIIDLKLSEKLGDESGFEFLNKFKLTFPDVPAIVITRYFMDPDMVVRCMRSGAYYYFIKEKFNDGQDNFITLVREAISYKPEHNVIEESYPHPIAILYRDCKRNVVAPQLKFERLIQLVEVTLKYCGIICLSEYVGSGLVDNKLSMFIEKKMSRPSLGHWNELLRFFSILNNKEAFYWIPQVLNVFTNRINKEINELIQIRNESIGHGSTKPEHEYLALVNECEPKINYLLYSAGVIGVWDLFLVKSSKKYREREYRHTIVNLKGHNPKFLTPERNLPFDLFVNKVHLFAADSQKVLSVHPLIIMALCPQCNQESIFFYSKFDRDIIHYLDYVNGHHLKSSEYSRDIIKVFN